MRKAAVYLIKGVAGMALCLVLVALVGAIFTIDPHATLFAWGEEGLATPTAICFGLLGTVALLLLWRALGNRLDAAGERAVGMVSAGLLALFAAVCVVLCVFVQTEPQNDSASVQDMALSMAQSGTLHIDTSVPYFQKYSNNDLLTILLSLYFRSLLALGVTNIHLAFVWLNAVCVVAGEVLAFFGAKTLFGLRRAAKYLLLSVMQPTVYLAVVWAYTNTLCLPFMCGLFFLAAKIWKSRPGWRRYAGIVLAALTTAVGYFLRPVVAIEAIALGMVALLACALEGRSLRRTLAGLCVALVALLVAGGALNQVANAYGGENSTNYPITHWLMMGLHDSGKFSETDSRFTRSFEGKTAKEQANLVEIKRSLKALGPLGLVVHAGTKQIITWSDGSGNYLLRMQKLDRDTALSRLLTGESRSFVMLYCQMYRSAVLLLAALALLQLLLRRRTDLRRFFVALSLFGGMLFYLIWEAKESYSIPFLFLLVLLAVLGQTGRGAGRPAVLGKETP